MKDSEGLRERLAEVMHESWSRTKRAQGFHSPKELCPTGKCKQLKVDGEVSTIPWPSAQCEFIHADLIPWADLPEEKKDINRHAFDDALPIIEVHYAGVVEAAVAAAIQDANEKWLKQVIRVRCDSSAPVIPYPTNTGRTLLDALLAERENAARLREHYYCCHWCEWGKVNGTTKPCSRRAALEAAVKGAK